MNFVKCVAWAVLLAIFLSPKMSAAADADTGSQSLIGQWRTMDDNGKASGIVRIYLQDGRYFGRLEQSFTPGDEARTCQKCKDDRRGQPLIGLLVLRNVIPVGNGYQGGDILDPDTGSVYKCKLHLEEGGKKLLVRGFIGFSLMGRTQVWERLK